MHHPPPAEIINAHLEAVDRGRRSYNRLLFLSLLASLENHGEVRRAVTLRTAITAVSHAGGDPAADPNVRQQYKAANKLLHDRHQRKHQSNPVLDNESMRRRDLWETYRKAAQKLEAISLDCRLLLVTLTVSDRHSWERRLEILNERLKKVRLVIRPHAVWYAEAFDVQGPPGYSPHAHILYLVPASACDGLSNKLRGKARFRHHLSWVDHQNQDRARPLLPDWKRRQNWLNRLAYIMKLSGDCGEKEFLKPLWAKEFQSVRRDFLKKAGADALNVQAMFGYYAGKGRRTFRAAIKVRSLGEITPTPPDPTTAAPAPAPGAKTPRRKAARGRPSTDPGRKKLRELRRQHATLIAMAAALDISVRSLRKWMRKHGLPLPRAA